MVLPHLSQAPSAPTPSVDKPPQPLNSTAPPLNHLPPNPIHPWRGGGGGGGGYVKLDILAFAHPSLGEMAASPVVAEADVSLQIVEDVVAKDLTDQSAPFVRMELKGSPMPPPF